MYLLKPWATVISHGYGQTGAYLAQFFMVNLQKTIVKKTLIIYFADFLFL